MGRWSPGRLGGVALISSDMEPPDADEYFGKALRTTAKEAQLLNARIST